MTVNLASATRNAAVSAAAGLVDAGAGAGVMELRTGAQPASADDAATGTLLATVTLVDPAFGAPVNGVATLADPVSVDAVASGDAGWFRVKDSTGVTVLDGSVTATAGGGDLELSSVTVTSGLPVDISGGTLTMPAS